VARHPPRVPPHLATLLHYSGEPHRRDRSLGGIPGHAEPSLPVIGEIAAPAELPLPREVERRLEEYVLRVGPQGEAERAAPVDEVLTVVHAVGEVSNARVFAEKMHVVGAVRALASKPELVR